MVLVIVLYEEGEDKDEKLAWDAVYWVFLGFELRKTRLDHVDLSLGIVEEGEEVSLVTLSGFEPSTKGIEVLPGVHPVVHSRR